jgi:hypothetical protein
MRLSLLRLIEIQLKNGYLKVPPPEYEFIKRYPPVANNANSAYQKIKRNKVPYLKYYRKALVRNPSLVGEHVFHAYWWQQPIAIVLAKKQYELIQSGLDEESAYNQALSFVNELESQAFDSLKETLNSFKVIKESNTTFVSDPSIASDINYWKLKLKEVSYEDLPIHDKGELDYFIQTKILKWNEVERERRMKDPVFFNYFKSLRSTIFPDIEPIIDPDHQYFARKNLLDEYYSNCGIVPNLMTTPAPFFYEDYAFFFKKLKDQPFLKFWSKRERQLLSRWIVEVLSFRLVVEKSTTSKVQNYLDLMRAQFFPMVQFPDQVSSYELPNIDKFRALLYHNDIGYKVADDKLHVRRFYRIPLLLFPVETVASTIILNPKILK